jgi:hypothetical protein
MYAIHVLYSDDSQYVSDSIAIVEHTHQHIHTVNTTHKKTETDRHQYREKIRRKATLIKAYEMVLMDYDQLSLDDLSNGEPRTHQSKCHKAERKHGKELPSLTKLILKVFAQNLHNCNLQFSTTEEIQTN